MTCSYVEENVPKLIVRDIFRNIPRFYCDLKNNISSWSFATMTSHATYEYFNH
jgi:hypothetical protein